MAPTSAEMYALILSALNYLQDDGGQFQRGVAKTGLIRQEFWLLTRFRYFPGTVAPSDFLTFGPYASASSYEQSLDSLVAKKFADKVEAGRYRVSETGRKSVEQLYRDYFNAIARHDRLSGPQVQRLDALADRTVAFVVRQPDVPAPITSAARSAFPETNRPWVYAERCVTAMAVFHEDASIAAWREDGWNGPRVAVSTALFKAAGGQLALAQLRAATVQLNDKDFQSALAALYAGGEVSCGAGDMCQLTAAGREARQLIEEMTDRNYAVLFNALTPNEWQELIELLEKLRGPLAA